MEGLYQRYSNLFEELFGETTLESTFPAINEIDAFVKSKISANKFAELYGNIKRIKEVCNDLVTCTETPIGSMEKIYLLRLNTLLTEYLENYNA